MTTNSNYTPSDRLSRSDANRMHNRIRLVQDFPKPGVLFRDVSPLLADGALFQAIVDAMGYFEPGEVDVVVGIEARGFALGAALASCYEVGFVPVRKGAEPGRAGKLPPPVDRVAYKLEYGEGYLELPQGAIESGSHVVIVDDVLGTGGTANGGAQLVRGQGGIVVGFQFLLAIAALGGMDRLIDGTAHASAQTAPVHTLLTY